MNHNDEIFEELTNELSQMKKAGEILTEQTAQAKKLTKSVESLVTDARTLQESLQSLQEKIAAEHKSAVDSLQATSQEIHQAVERFFNQQLQRYQEQLTPLLEEYQRVINEYRSIDIAAHFQQQLHALAGIKSDILAAFNNELQQLPFSQIEQTLNSCTDTYISKHANATKLAIEEYRKAATALHTEFQQYFDQQQRSFQNLFEQFNQQHRRYQDLWAVLSSTLEKVDSHLSEVDTQTKHLKEIAAKIPQVLSESVQHSKQFHSQLLDTLRADIGDEFRISLNNSLSSTVANAVSLHSENLEKSFTEQFESLRTELQQYLLDKVEEMLRSHKYTMNEIIHHLQEVVSPLSQTLSELSHAIATKTSKIDLIAEQLQSLPAQFKMIEQAINDFSPQIHQSINNQSQQLTRQYEQLVAITASVNALGQNQHQQEQAFASQVNMLTTQFDKISSEQRKELRSTLIATTIVAALLALLLAVTIVQ